VGGRDAGDFPGRGNRVLCRWHPHVLPSGSVRASLPAQRHRRAGFSARARRSDLPLRGTAMRALIAVLPGDGIGPEVVGQASRVLEAAATRFGHQFELVEAPIGGVGIDRTGTPLPAATLALCLSSAAVLLGAVGGPKWDPQAAMRPEQGLLDLRRLLGLFANLRPVSIHPRLVAASPLKPEILKNVDLVFVRELTGG